MWFDKFPENREALGALGQRYSSLALGADASMSVIGLQGDYVEACLARCYETGPEVEAGVRETRNNFQFLVKEFCLAWQREQWAMSGDQVSLPAHRRPWPHEIARVIFACHDYRVAVATGSGDQDAIQIALMILLRGLSACAPV